MVMADCIKRRRVLIVDDDDSVTELLVDLLRREGYEIATATHGEDALALLPSFDPDIVVSDVVMPVMDGIELCRRIKESPQTGNIPVLLVSGLRIEEHDSVE